MQDLSTGFLFGVLGFLILLSGFFSSSETGMMSLNPYRLKHLVKSKHPGARKAQQLLERPDRLIGIILIGNNFVNILASSIATVIAIRLFGDSGIAIATGILTLVILVFAEVTPKTMAALKPEAIAFPAAFVLDLLLKITMPLVWALNAITNGLLALLGVKPVDGTDSLSREELRTVVNESGNLIPTRHRKMLLSILDLEKVTVDDIMVPRNEVIGLDLDDDMDVIIEQLRANQHTRLPVYKSDMNNPLGILHARNAARFLLADEKTKALLLQHTVEPYFVPSGTQLNTQLVNFQKEKRRVGLVVDEYGDVKGIVTIEDILEEIVGEFTTDMAATSKDIHPQDDGSFYIDGSATIREINRALKWKLPTNGPKTLNGVIMETLETIPQNPISIRVGQYVLEIKQIKDNQVRTARAFVLPSAKKPKLDK